MLYGDTGADLVYTPATPCRIINTLVAGGPIAAGTTRSFRVTGSGFTGQGGVAGSCGVPVGATGAVINFVAVNPAGAGDLRFTPFGTPVPVASFLNYVKSGIPNDNTANGMTFPICNPATTTCTNDFTIQADVSATDVVADVQGYFRALPTAGRAFGIVNTALALSKAKNLTSVSRPFTGIYCVLPATTISPASSPAYVTVEWGGSAGNDLLAFIFDGNADCLATEYEVQTYTFAGGGQPVLSNSVAFQIFIP